MPHLEVDKHEEPEFKWLKEKEGGKKYRDIHFYESFVYEGVEYSLYDSVYLQVEYDQPPYIGKLVGIWEEADKSKKIRVQWFFQPWEILYYLRDTEVIENELFLASGCGIGLGNINPLEAIVGKCNVVCVSTDDRNPKLSEDEEKMADHVFYRIFDVQHFMISDQFSDTIGELKVNFVFNKKESSRTLSSPKFESNEHDSRNAIVFKDTGTLVSASSPIISSHSNGDCNHMAGNNDTNAEQNKAIEKLSGDVENGSFIRERTSGGKCTNVDVNSSEDKTATSIIDNGSALGGNIVGCKTNTKKDEVKERKSRLKQARFEENMKSMESRGLNDTSLKRGMNDGILSKDNGKNIDLNSSKYRQAISIAKNTISSNDGCQVNIENKKVKDPKSPLKNASFGEKVRSNTKSVCLNDTSLKRGKLDVSSSEDGETISNIGNKNVSCVKSVDDTCLKRGKLNDKSSEDNGKTSVSTVSNSIISRNIPEMQVNSATSVDAKLKFEIDKDFGGLRKDVKPSKSSTILKEKILDVQATSPKTLESDHVTGLVSQQKDLKSTKCLNDASRGKPSRINDILVDEALNNKSNEVFERHVQVARHIKLSSDTTSQLSKTLVYPQNGEMKHGHNYFKREDLSSMEGLCLVDAPSKKAKFDDHKPGKENNMEVISKMKEKSCGIGQGRTNHAFGACEREDLILAKDSCVIERASKKAKLDGSSKTSKLNTNDVFQNPKEEIHYNEDGKAEGEIFGVSPRPISEKRTWLKLGNVSWESMKTAQNEGKLVLLQNLDPTLTSAEDIIWHAFQEKCMAKMVQQTAMSSPHNGQALLIFDAREVAERVLKELDDKCLMLLDQRPLVGRTVLLPEYPRKQTSFVGHLSIDKVRRLLMQREMKEAVSTSHYSQPKTIEYEMAVEWSLLQSKSNIWCQELFQLHELESRKFEMISNVSNFTNQDLSS